VKEGGLVLLTVDLEPFSRRLWRMAEGVEVESAEDHGTLDDLLGELASNGLDVVHSETRDWLPAARVGLAFIVASPRRGGRLPGVASVPREATGRAISATRGLVRGRSAWSVRLRTRLRLNPLFDAGWYVARYPDVGPRWRAQVHFRRHGVRENRNPNELFDTKWYLERYPESRTRAGNPLDDYVLNGVALGLDPGPSFSTQGYLARYPDIASSGINPLLHYLQHGRAEGREPVTSRTATAADRGPEN
jgi:hypothetical protein